MKFFNYIHYSLNVILFFISAFISVASDSVVNLELWEKSILILLMLILFMVLEAFKNKQIDNETKEKIINAILSKSEELSFLTGNEQKIRANIFQQQKQGFFRKVNTGYKIVNQYNMDNDQDKDLHIPENMGVTGEVFRTRTSRFASRDGFNPEARFRLPVELIAIVPEEVHWIYSTPVKYRNGKVIMTLTIDGTELNNNPQDVNHVLDKEKIERVANKIVSNLQSIVFND